MKFVKVSAIVLGSMYQHPASFANAADTIHHEEVQVTSVSIESRQTSLIHLLYICILYLAKLIISIGRIRYKLGCSGCEESRGKGGWQEHAQPTIEDQE